MSNLLILKETQFHCRVLHTSDTTHHEMKKDHNLPKPEVSGAPALLGPQVYQVVSPIAFTCRISSTSNERQVMVTEGKNKPRRALQERQLTGGRASLRDSLDLHSMCVHAHTHLPTQTNPHTHNLVF